MTATASVSDTPLGETPLVEPKYSSVLENLWAPFRISSKGPHGVVDIDRMVTAVTSPNSKVKLTVKLTNDDIASLKEVANDLKANHWITESRRRFILAGTLGELLANRCQADEASTDDSAGCGRACQAAKKIRETDDLHAVLAAMLLLPETEFQNSRQNYKGDDWMISGHYQVPLQGVDLRRKWDIPFEDKAKA
jgi:hypothetical protein